MCRRGVGTSRPHGPDSLARPGGMSTRVLAPRAAGLDGVVEPADPIRRKLRVKE